MSAFGIRVCAALVALMLPAMAMAADTPEEPAAVPMPRVKPTPAAPPTPPPQPRIKPAAAPAAVPPAAVVPAPVPIPRPTEAEIKAGALPCGEACGDILFKTVEGCLWLQSQNPKPITFQANIDGRLIELQLEGASYEKSAAAPAAPAPGVTAYHTRQKDPFQSASAGIPVYRVRLGEKDKCLTDRGQIRDLMAVFRK